MSQGESKLSRDIMAALRARGAFVFKVHGGPTMMTGLPDICGVWCGLSIWIETKMPGGQDPTPIQLYRHARIIAAGGYVLVARSVADVVTWLGVIQPPDTP